LESSIKRIRGNQDRPLKVGIMLRIKNVKYLKEYKLKITFSNEITKVVDFENWIFEDNVYLKLLRDIQFFKKVRLDECKYSICWPNGADFSPETLYEAGEEIQNKTAPVKKTRPRPKRKIGGKRN